MTAYLIANIKVTDDAWVPNYAANVHGIIHKHGGEYLARSANITPVEGEAPDATVIAIVKFPSVQAAQAFVKDTDYAPHAEARRAGTDSRFFIIDNTDVAGSIPYLPKG